MKILDILEEANKPDFITWRNQIKNGEQRDAIFNALESGNFDEAKKLMNGNVETYTDAMLKALDADKLKVAEILLNRFGANPDVSHNVAMNHAAADGRLDKMKLLAKYGGNADTGTALNWAIQQGRINVLKWLNDKNVKPDGNTFAMVHRFLIEPQGRNASDQEKARLIKLALSFNPKPDQFVYPDMLEFTKNDPMANKLLRQYGQKFNLTDKTKFKNSDVVNRHGSYK